MDDNRCPMCGKDNPVDREECEHCGARLVPLGELGSSGAGELGSRGAGVQGSGGSGDEDVAWEQEGSEAGSGEAFSEFEAEGDADWLSDLREEDKVEVSATSPEEPASEAESDFDAEEAPDWLARLDDPGEHSEEPGEAGSEEAFSEVEAEGGTDWREQFGEDLKDKDLKGFEKPFRSEEEEGGRDWLSYLNEKLPAEQEAEDAAEELDWTPDEGLEKAEIPEWLNEEPPEEQGAEDAAEVLDWTAGEGLEKAEIPEWLEELEKKSAGAPEDQEALEDEAPDWLEQMRQREEQAQQEGTPEDSPEPAAHEWMEELEEEDLKEEDLEGFGEPFRSEEEADWLPAGADALAEPAISQEFPAWLSEMSEPAVEESEPESLPDEQSEVELPSEEMVVPDWLAEMSKRDEPGGMSPEDSEEPTELEESKEDFLASFEEDRLEDPAQQGSGGTAAESAAREQGALSGREEETRPRPAAEWFHEETPEEPAEREPADAEISRAEIPSWLAAMRPVEDAAPRIGRQEAPSPRVESAGPLSGFRGVLSPQPEVGQVPKPPTYSVKLQVSENQKSHADLLMDLVARESEAQAIPRPAMISPQHILRSAIALILIAAVLWPLITGSQEAPLPNFSPGTAAVNQVINRLPDQARVLVAFDYEPALTAEMEATASPVIDHLMLRGAYLSLVSTSPLGPILAERFLSTTQREHGYASGSQYVNLGYIPGGPAGLQAFAESPGRVLPYTLEGSQAWERDGQPAPPPLQGVTGLSDFDLVMVVTDSPEAARTWVEQAQPFLEDESAQTPLVMITSAQAEPLVRPYAEPASGQVQGLLSGLRDGGAYGRMTGQEGLPRKYWDAFGLGLWAAAAVVAVGGLVGLAISSQQSAVSKRREAKSGKK